jgi:ankyrin repeat protein
LIYAALSPQSDMVEVLLQAGAEVDAQADDGSTALIKATLWNHSEIVALLLRSGAQPAIQDADG